MSPEDSDDAAEGEAADAPDAPEDAVARTRLAYERIADDYDERNAAVAPVEDLLEAFRAALPDRDDGPRVLDAGCGHGRDAAWLGARGCRVVALDFAAAQLANARERAPDAALVRGDLRDPPLPAARFDGVLAMASLLHLPRETLPGALADLRRVLRPGGVLGVSVQRTLGEDEAVDAAFGREGRYFVAHEAPALRERLTDAGLSVVSVIPDGNWVWVLARRPA